MRLGSICDLKIQSLERAAPDLPLKGFYALQLVQAQLRQCTRNSV